MKKLLLLIIVGFVLSLAANVQAVNLWFDDTTGDGLWNTAENWTVGGDPNTTPIVPTAGDWAKPRDGNTAHILSGDDAICYKITIGTCTEVEGPSGVTVDGGTLTIAGDNQDLVVGRDGVGVLSLVSGTIDIDDNLMLGYDIPGTPGIVNITGGTINIGRDLELPDDNIVDLTGHFTMNGGTVNIGDDLDMDADGSGWLQLDGGTINVNDDLEMVVGGSTIDITFGTMILEYNSDNNSIVPEFIANGAITGFGLTGNVSRVDTEDTITLTAAGDPLERIPTYNAAVDVRTSLNVDFSWKNLDPNNPDDDVWVDIWLGTDMTLVQNQSDPNIWEYVDFAKVVDAEVNKTATTVAVPDPNVSQAYLWRIDTYRYGNPAIVSYGDDDDPNTDDFQVDEGFLIPFTVADNFPPTVVEDPTRWVHWVNEPITVYATVYDDGESDVTVLWDSGNEVDPNITFGTPVTVIPAQADYSTTGIVVSTTVSVDYATNNYNVRVRVTDTEVVFGTRQSLGLCC